MGKEVVLDLHPEESIISVSRKHWFSFVGNIVVVLVLIVLFLIVVFFGNAAISNVSYAKIFDILMEYIWLFGDIILSGFLLFMVSYSGVAFGKKYFNSVVFKDIIDVFNRHRFAFIAGYALFIIMALLFAIILVVNTQLHSEGIAMGRVFSNDISKNLGKGVLVIFSGMYALAILAYFYISWLDFYMDVFVITNRRIIRIEQVIVFSRKTSETSFQHIQDASSHVRGFVYSMLDIGGIFVETAGENENFTFFPVAHPNELATKILRLQRLGWMDEGVKDQFAGDRMVEEGIRSVKNAIKKRVSGARKMLWGRDLRAKPLVENKHYNDGRIIIEEGVIWQSDQEMTSEIEEILRDM